MTATAEPQAPTAEDIQWRGAAIDQDRARWLAVRPNEVHDAADVRALAAVFLTNLRGTGWGKDLTPANAFALAVAASQTNLNPLLGEIVCLGGNIYVTEHGTLANADRHPAYDGYDIEPLTDEERALHKIPADDFAYKCTVHRKDRSRPTVGIGRASKTNVRMQEISNHFLIEMAQKRAVERAHSRAFSLPFAGMDEPSTLALAQSTSPVQNTAEVLLNVEQDDERVRQVNELARQLKWTPARIEVETKNVKGDVDKLLAVMAREMEHQHERTTRRSHQQPDTIVAKVEDAETAREVLKAANSKAPAASTDEGATNSIPAAEAVEPAAEPAIPAQQDLSLGAPGPEGQKIKTDTRKALMAMLGELGVKEPKEKRLAWAAGHGIIVKSFTDLSEAQALYLCKKAEEEGPPERHEAEQPSILNLYTVKGPGPCVCCEKKAGETHDAGCPEAGSP